MPVTMSLFGMMNWMDMWFKDGGRISREDYADVATTLILEGIKAVLQKYSVQLVSEQGYEPKELDVSSQVVAMRAWTSSSWKRSFTLRK